MSQDYTDDVFTSTGVVQTQMANVENNFAALKSSFSGATAPSNLIAGMWWFDTTSNILKLRNEANSAWQSVWNFASNKPVITNLSNEITGAMIAASAKDPAAGTAGLRTLGTTSVKACAGNDSRLSDNRTPPDAGVSQAKLKTSQGNVQLNYVVGVASQLFTLPGGEYGFYPRIRFRVTNSTGREGICEAKIFYDAQDSSYDSGYVTRIYITLTDNETSWPYVNAQQRYVTSSGEVFWIFILRDKTTKKIIAMWQAPDHPCFGNGGKPLLVPHPFGNYDESKHEIIVINPTNAEIEQMELETIVDDETKPDKDLLQVITENYEIDENSSPAWPTKEVTVGLPKHIKDHKGKRALVDYRFMSPDTIVKPIKKVIPKPSYIKVKRLKRK